MRKLIHILFSKPINFFVSILLWLAVIYGAVFYKVFGFTPKLSYQSLVRLFCVTGGVSSDIIAAFISGFSRRVTFSASADGILGSYLSTPEKYDLAVSQLDEQGYVIFERALPNDICDALLKFALLEPCTPRRLAPTERSRLTVATYPRANPTVVCYDFDQESLLGNEHIQDLISDESILRLAQDYLRAPPKVDVLAMWWQTAVATQANSMAAQLFHFDLDRVKWLKVFIYLTDVCEDNGPHVFVEGTHKSGVIPQSLLNRGYVRLSDDDVIQALGSKRIVEFSAPKGTIIIEDTRGLHKSRVVERADRLLFQFQLSNSLYGGDFKKMRRPVKMSDRFYRVLQTHREIYKAIL